MMKFETEADLCEAFIKTVNQEWIVYPETCGFDIVLVHEATKKQIGVEAKLRLNAKVINQILPQIGQWYTKGPDFRAVLVPRVNDMASLCEYIGVSILVPKQTYGAYQLPILENCKSNWYSRHDDWVDWCPEENLLLPEVVPDTKCGTPSPLILTSWKIKAIKLLILLDEFGMVTTHDFNQLSLNRGLWVQNRWLAFGKARGTYHKCDSTPDFRAEHPKNYEEIKANIDNWLPENRKIKVAQKDMLQ